MQEEKKDCGELELDSVSITGDAGVSIPAYAVIVELDAELKSKTKKDGKDPVIPVRWKGRRRSDQHWEDIERAQIDDLQKRNKALYRVVIACDEYDRIAPEIVGSSGIFRVKLDATFTE